MTLPSQAARSGTTARTFTRSRRRRRGPSRGPLALTVLAVIVLVGGAWVLLGPGASLLTSADDPQTGAGAGAAVNENDVPQRDALSQPRSWGARGMAPTEAIAEPVAEPATERSAEAEVVADPPRAEADASNLSEARRRRGSTAAPSPLAAALEAEESTSQSTPQAQPSSQPQQRPGTTTAPAGAVTQALRAADAEVQRGRPSAARQILEGVLSSSMSASDASLALEALSALNSALLFGPSLYDNEPLTRAYVVQPGDSLSRIASREELGVDWRLIQRVNGIDNPSRIRLGQTLKLVSGPFHVIVDKSDYRLDLYHGDAERPGEWRYIASYPVGLGEDDSTPTGSFAVRANSRLINPHWVNPRTGQKFDADDPANPIGERWIGIEGLGADAIKTGYGLHGTIEPESIGAQRSMGCIRLRDADVELLYELLLPGSLVTIRE